ncbi:MAG: hypothetical protein J6J12_10400 [Oscillospiraceae bacterium]|nr:hypothetical protein [Oscillospiraceae bacterium]
MEKVKLYIESQVPHASQIITGFLILKEQGWDVELVDARSSGSVYCGIPLMRAEYRGKKIVYDVGDGYNVPDDMEIGLKDCDFYFKRSFSDAKNRELLPAYVEKMYPLGFNYHVTHPKNPINEPLWKHLLKPLMGRAPDRYFVPEVFEGKAEWKDSAPKILFLTRLWEQEEGLPPEVNEERVQINEMRIRMIKTLRQRYGDAFVGGVNDTPLSRELAPELIMPSEYTERKKYLKLLHSCDICIGSMGLFESIGWKTGEYVAAAKAIVNERFHFTVTGDYREGEHYLPFETAEECLEAVAQLAGDPQRLYAMKKANEAYYQAYLKPEVLVKNTLKLIDRALEEKF